MESEEMKHLMYTVEASHAMVVAIFGEDTPDAATLAAMNIAVAIELMAQDVNLYRLLAERALSRTPVPEGEV